MIGGRLSFVFCYVRFFVANPFSKVRSEGDLYVLGSTSLYFLMFRRTFLDLCFILSEVKYLI